jgi:protein SCO1/2
VFCSLVLVSQQVAKFRWPLLLIALLPITLLISGCATYSSKPPAVSSCCATNLQQADSAPTPAPLLPGKSIYQLDSVWTTDAGQPFKLSMLRGRPQILAMFFTSCQNACPITVSDMKRIEAALPESLRSSVGFTLVSFDPERDTTAALRAYRLRRGLDESRWTLLRGEPADVAQLATRVGMNYKYGARGQFSHSNIITVLNRDGEVVRQQTGLNQSIEQTVAIVQQIAVP